MSTAHERQIASLVAENNALHQQLVAAADAHDQHARKTALVIRRLESELCDVRFLNAQHLLRIQLEQRRVEDERRRADDLMKKWHVWTGKSRVAEPPAAAAAQRLELPNGPLAPMVFSAAAGNGPGGARPPSPTLFVADMVKLAEARSRDEQQRANDLEAVVADMDAQLADAKAQLGTREAEIQRLTLLLQSGRGAGGGGSNGNGGDYPRPEHLERQLDLVQSTLEDVKTAAEKKEASLQARLRDATAANDRLQAELVSLKQQVTALQQASDQSVLVDLTDEVEALRGLLQTAHREYEALSRELSTATAPPPQSGPPPATTCANCAQRSSTAAASVSAAAVQADLATATNSQPMQDLQAQLEHERHLRSALVSELRALNDAVASLAGQCEQLVREREQQSQQQQQQQQQQPQKQQRSSSIADSPTPCQSCVALRASCLSLDAENRRLLSQVAALQSTHRELETQLVDHSECAPRLDSAQVEIRRLTFERGDLCRTAEEQKTTLQSLRQELAEASARAEIARQSATKLTTLNMELAELRAIKSTLDAQLRQTTATSNQHLAQIGYLHQRAQELELEKRVCHRSPFLCFAILTYLPFLLYRIYQPKSITLQPT
ncbi:hypothetical protein BC828DRAFT_390860 [Blastocladiella britannica]|nr:hypothetical protein BC828DRAFT_390860 [Blastocladiella britannica]